MSQEIKKNTKLPFDIKMKTFNYDQILGEIDIEIEENLEFYKYVGQELKLERAATHEEATAFFVDIVGKSLAGQDGFEIECNKEGDPFEV